MGLPWGRACSQEPCFSPRKGLQGPAPCSSSNFGGWWAHRRGLDSRLPKPYSLCHPSLGRLREQRGPPESPHHCAKQSPGSAQAVGRPGRAPAQLTPGGACGQCWGRRALLWHGDSRSAPEPAESRLLSWTQNEMSNVLAPPRSLTPLLARPAALATPPRVSTGGPVGVVRAMRQQSPSHETRRTLPGPSRPTTPAGALCPVWT